MSDKRVAEFKSQYDIRGDEDFHYQVQFLSWLAQKYEDEGYSWTSLLRAHTLYISCAVRDPKNGDEWRKRAHQIQLKFWTSSLQSFPDHQKLTTSLKLQLQGIRNKRRQQIEKITDTFHNLSYEFDQLNCDENQDLYKVILEDVPTISTAINQDMVSFTSTMVQEAITIYGSPPSSHFCVVGMGSMAKGETTPYSDLEFLFLVKEECSANDMQYFEGLAVTIYFLIGNLGETKLKYMAIPELMTWSDTKKDYVGHWFDDKATTSGFKIDGIGSWAGNIPTGGDDPEQHDQFICTVEQLAKKYRSVFDSPRRKNSVNGDFSALLASTIYVYGDKQLHDEFRAKIQSYRPHKEREDATLEMLISDMDRYNLQPDEKLTHTKHLKNDVYRYPSILLYDLKILYGIEKPNPWQVIAVLQSENLISASTAQCLKFSLCCALTMRLAAYFYHDSQDESISVLNADPDNNLYKGAWYVRPELLTHMFLHLVPLKAAVREVFCGSDHKRQIDVRITSVTKSETLALVQFHCENYASVVRILKLAGYPECIKTVDLATLRRYIISAINCNEFENLEQLLLKRTQSEQYNHHDFHNMLAMLYTAQCRYSEAQNCWETQLRMLIREDSDRGPIFATLHNLGKSLSDQCQYKKALSHYSNCLAMALTQFGEKYNMSTVKLLISKGVAHWAEGQHAQALVDQGVALTMLRKLCGKRDHPHIASILHNRGTLLSELGNNKEAMKVLNECLAMRERLSDNKEHLSIANTLNSIAGILLRHGRYEQALENFAKCLDMRNKLLGNTAHVDTTGVLSNMASCFSNLDQYPKAFMMLKQCLAMYRQLFPGENRADIALALNNLGLVQLEMGHIDDGMEKLKQSLDMSRRIYHDTNHIDVARALSNIGLALIAQKRYKEALAMHLEAFAIQQRILNHRDHGDIAAAMNNIGLALNYQGLCNEALYVLRKCLAMRLRLFGNTNHPDIVAVLVNIGAILQKQGLDNQALLTQRRCLAMTRILSGDKPSFNIAAIHNNIGETLLAMGHVADALVEYTSSLTVLTQIFGSGPHPYVDLARKNVEKAQCFVSLMKVLATIKLK